MEIGQRVQVKLEFDETWRLLRVRTGPGTILDIYDDEEVVVGLDSGHAIPYYPEELDILDAE